MRSARVKRCRRTAFRPAPPGARERVMHAAGLIREGATALEAATASGFNDYSNFYKAFHQVFGTSPVRYLADCERFPW